MQNLEHNLKEIIDIVGTDNLVTDKESLSFYSTDVFETAKEQAVAIVRPTNADELIEVTQTCIKNEVPIIVRGGGASYTGGYLPVVKNTLIIDTINLKAIEINEEDMYVTVEPGVTWLELYETLKPLGLRTPFWGPFSGKVSTVGGSMSFHALSHGTNMQCPPIHYQAYKWFWVMEMLSKQAHKAKTPKQVDSLDIMVQT